MWMPCRATHGVGDQRLRALPVSKSAQTRIRTSAVLGAKVTASFEFFNNVIKGLVYPSAGCLLLAVEGTESTNARLSAQVSCRSSERVLLDRFFQQFWGTKNGSGPCFCTAFM